MEENYSTEGLDKSELEHLMDLSECAMFIAKREPDIEVQYANKRFYSMLQYTPQEFAGEYGGRLMGIILPEEKQKMRNLIARQLAAGGMLQLEFRVRKKDGLPRWISMKAQTVEADGQVWYYCSCMDITQQKRALDDIYSAKRDAELITNSIPGGVIKIRMSDFALLYANDGFFRLSGYSRIEYHSLFGDICSSVIHPEDLEMVKKAAQTAVENRGSLGVEYRIFAKNGEVRWSYANGCRVDDQDGEAVYLCIIMDVSTRKKLEEKLEDNVRRSKYLLNFMKETEWTYQIEEKKVYRSGYLEGTYSPEEEIEGLFEEGYLKSFVHLEDVGQMLRDVSERKAHIGHTRAVYRMKDGKGDYNPCAISMISVDSKGKGKPDIIYGETILLEDDSYMLKQQKQRVLPDVAVPAGKVLTLAKMARAKYEDSVTELMPYDHFLEKVQEQLEMRDEDENYGLLCCDINGFQKLTYHYGLSIGDEVLKMLSGILKEYMAYNNLCSRVNGDYFVSFFTYTHYDELLKKISHMLQVQTGIEEKQSYSTDGTTSGIYLIRPEDMDVEDMLQKADLARRSIKGTRGSHYAIYTDELQTSHFWEDEVIRDIESSLKEHSVEICYLPRIRGERENVIGCKAIPRVPLKGGDYLSLEDLHRYTERSEAACQLVFYVLAGVCNNLGAWKAGGKKIMPVSVDITAGQLCMQNAVNKIDEIVKSNKLEAKDIFFEIQEPYFAELSTKFEIALKDLNKRGYRIIISRFGSDHTAIHSLRRLPISVIKFHGEYFNQSVNDEKEHIIFCKIVEMAHALGMEVACGGIRTKLQEEIARSIGCNVLEGDIYYGTVRSDVYEKCFLS